MTADDLGTPGRDEWYGYGLVDAGKAGKPPETENTTCGGECQDNP